VSPCLRWRKSSRSGNVTNCVEVADLGARLRVRDSKNPAPTLSFPRQALVRLFRA
jgi:hypothetical protein